MSNNPYGEEYTNDAPQLPGMAQTFNVPDAANLPARRNVIPDGALVPSDNGLTVGAFTITQKGLLIGEGATLKDFEYVGDVLHRMESGIQWLIGDWLAYGEKTHGRTVKEIASALEREEKTLWNYTAVARAVDYSRRREVLTFGHHETVAKLDADQQDYWLNRAVAEGWSVAQMRKAMRPAGGGGVNWDEEVRRSSKAVWNAMETIKEAQGVESAIQFVIRQGEILDEMLKSLQGGG